MILTEPGIIAISRAIEAIAAAVKADTEFDRELASSHPELAKEIIKDRIAKLRFWDPVREFFAAIRGDDA